MSGVPRGAWRALESETLCDSPYLRLCQERVATPTRPEGVSWMVVHRREAAVVAPQTPEGKFVLIRQERIAVRCELWEFPAGQVDEGMGEVAIRETALRELQEEAGLAAEGGLVPLGSFYSSVGFTDERMHLFLARNAVPARGGGHDEMEAILEVRAFTAAELSRMVGDGIIVDSNTLATYARLCARGLLDLP